MSSDDRQAYVFIPVKLSPGIFENEVTVEIVVEGRSFQSIVPREYVKIQKEPTQSTLGEGQLRVRVVEPSGEGKTWVDMPQASFTSQPRILIQEEELIRS